MKPFVPSLTSQLGSAPARKRGRPPGIGRRRIGKRLAIAQAVVAGKPIASIARELGVSRSWESREAPRAGHDGDDSRAASAGGEQVKALLSEFYVQLAVREHPRFEARLEERRQM
jgi:transposase-like protein